MTEMLRGALTLDQQRLLRVICEPFHESGEWPLWQYADLTMDRMYGTDAAVVLESLPAAGERGPMSMSYGLIWRNDSHMSPRPDTEIAVTVAGLRYIGEAAALLDGFLAFILEMIETQRNLKPDPRQVVEAEVSSDKITHLVRLAHSRGDRRLSDEICGSHDAISVPTALAVRHASDHRAAVATGWRGPEVPAA